MKSMYTNANSIGSKQEELGATIQQESCDVVTKTEMQCKSGHPQDSCLLELVDRDEKQNGLPVIQKEAVSGLLSHLDAHKSMGPDDIHPRVMRGVVEELTKLLSIIYHQSWLTRKVQVTGKVMEHIILSAITQYKQDNQRIRHSQHRLRKGKSCLTNLMSFYDVVTCLVVKGQAVVVVYLDFSKAFEISPIPLSWQN
ncbi:hypothetical protein RLOC_00003645 [Lonchura striata]|uniref:Reverse transcriptase domain-containing protein n=1 Tax=Lonchura striata TaxID=40157 RepID=A0A218VD57_9PASE|nr:hypothetical protein RLOC_00003645 [Lonchura striata domestica]